MAESRGLCLVMIPSGTARDTSGRELDFDAIFRKLIEPATVAVGLQPVLSDVGSLRDLVRKEQSEDLLLWDHVLADLSTADPVLFYWLGMRQAVRAQRTSVIFAKGARVPVEMGLLRAMGYAVDRTGIPAQPSVAISELTRLLRETDQAREDDGFLELVDGQEPSEIRRLKTDVFRERVEYSSRVKDELAAARREGRGAVQAVQNQLVGTGSAEFGVLVDLLLSFRAVKAWQDMIELVEQMPGSFGHTVLVREQYALALNRNDQGGRAERVLLELISERGPSSETYGILGRVYKDRWQAARQAGAVGRSTAYLRQAIDAYLKGFQTDWRDAYPGINAVTLMDLCDPPDPRRKELLPVVTYAVNRRIEMGEQDYWDHATLLELAILAEDFERAWRAVADVVAAVREPWEIESTVYNVRLIRETRQHRGDSSEKLLEIEEALTRAMPVPPHR